MQPECQLFCWRFVCLHQQWLILNQVDLMSWGQLTYFYHGKWLNKNQTERKWMYIPTVIIFKKCPSQNKCHLYRMKWVLLVLFTQAIVHYKNLGRIIHKWSLLNKFHNISDRCCLIIHVCKFCSKNSNVAHFSTDSWCTILVLAPE